jgi:hypothetical protein
MPLSALPVRFGASSMMKATAPDAVAPVLVVHGGAGVVRREMTAERERAARADLQQALAAGYAVLQSGGSSLDAVQQAIVVLEDSPLFNAGKGAVFMPRSWTARACARARSRTCIGSKIRSCLRVRCSRNPSTSC